MSGENHRTPRRLGRWYSHVCWCRYQSGRATGAVLVSSVYFGSSTVLVTSFYYVELRSGLGPRVEANTDKLVVDGSYGCGRNYPYS